MVGEKPFFYCLFSQNEGIFRNKNYMSIFRFFSQKKRVGSHLWGKRGEDLAERYLKKIGYEILAKNYINKRGYRIGEIDIIALDGKELVFVEVKTRKRVGKFELPPESAVNRVKLGRLQKSAFRYLEEFNRREERYRFDVVSIIYDGYDDITIKHLKNIFL